MIVDVVVPCFNEEAVIEASASVLVQKLRSLVQSGLVAKESAILFVDDGSQDHTWALIERLAQEEAGQIRGIKLSRNRGHQNALLAGLFTSTADAVISIDADLQDDVGAIEKMIEAHYAGAEIVLGVRSSRTTDSFFKRTTAEAYYYLLAWCNVEVVFNHADYRLLGRQALDTLKEFPEVNLFLRGLIPQLGFNTKVVEYARVERFAGESKYPLRKMLSLAWDGITSFSNIPLRWVTTLGFAVASFAFALGLWVLWVALIRQEGLPGWASTVLPVYFLGGAQLVAIGIIGEYVAKAYMETKRRPRYVIEKII